MSSNHDSLTPLRPKRTERQKSFTPKSAMNSLRQHMHPSGKGKAKRGVLSDITGSPYSETRGDSGPEVSTSQAKGPSVAARSGERSPTKQHGKTATVARSMIGSLRSLSRRAQSLSNPASPPSEYGSPTSQAMATPLPSSPVNVPAPTLKLDLGDISNMSTSFLSDVPGFEQKKELVALTDSVDDAGMRLQTDYSRVSTECPPDTILSADGLGQDELPADELLTMPHDDSDSSPSESSTTPVSGTGVQLDFDGIFDEPPLFERSVEALGSPEKRENKSLKKIVSMNALAGKHIKDSLRRGMRLSSASSRKVRDYSESTMQHWPRDMEPLTHQFTALSKPGVDHSDPATGAWKSEDPFATGNDDDDWAADSPEREVLLPDCPKIELRTPANAVRLHNQDVSRNDTTSLDDAVPQLGLTPVEDVLLGQMQARLIAARAVVDHASHPRPMSSAARLEPVSDSLKLQERGTDDASTKFSSRLSSAQYDQFHAEHFLGLEECLPGDPPPSTIEQQENTPERPTRTPDNDQPSTPEILRPSTGVAMPRIPSPAQKQSVSSDTWQFSVHDWLQGGRLPATWSSQPPHYHTGSDNASLDSVPIAEHRTTAQISPKTTILGHSPCMGDRLSFDVNRSDRNMRYSALSEMSNASVPEHEESAMTSSMRHHRMLQCAGLDSRYDRESSFPNFETAFTSSARRPLPTERVSLRGVVDHEPSSDSIESDLEQVITDHYVFQNALGDFEVMECSNASGDGEPVPTTSTTQVGECGSPSRNPCVTPTFQANELREQLEQGETADLSQTIVPSTTAIATARVPFHNSAVDQSADESEAVGLPIEYVFRTPASGISPTDSLDDHRHLYKSYEACQSHLPENHLSSDSENSKAKLSPPADSDGSEGGPRSQCSTVAAPSRLSDTDYRSIESKKFKVEESDDHDF